MADASRFLNQLEQRCSTNEQEGLAVVRSIGDFSTIYMDFILLQLDHQPQLSALKNNRGFETYQSNLTRWAEKLLPFLFDVVHLSSKKGVIAN